MTRYIENIVKEKQTELIYSNSVHTLLLQL